MLTILDSSMPTEVNTVVKPRKKPSARLEYSAALKKSALPFQDISLIPDKDHSISQTSIGSDYVMSDLIILIS